MDYYIEPLKKYADFHGRARRKEYWYFSLFNILIVFCLALIEGFFGLFPDAEESILGNIYYLTILLPSIAVGVRRMHDVGKSGWFILFPFYNLILACTDGTEGPNKYGPDPKGETRIRDDGDRFCSQCGSICRKGATFCRQCGNRVLN